MNLEDQIESINDASTLKVLLRRIIASPEMLSSGYVEELELGRVEDEQKIDQLRVDLALAKEHLCSVESLQRRTMCELEAAKIDLQTQTEEIANASERRRIARERDVADRIKADVIIPAAPAVELIVNRSDLSRLEGEVDLLRLKLIQEETRSDAMRTDLFEQISSLQTTLCELQQSLDAANDHISALDDQIIELNMVQPSADTPASKSLLSDIDDHRLLVEGSHNKVLNAYSALAKKHTILTAELLRVKNYCTQLQLAPKIDGEGLKSLKQSLHQCEAEKKELHLESLELRATIDKLQLIVPSMQVATRQPVHSRNTNDATLRTEIQQLKRTIDSLKIQRLAEADKTRKLEELVCERDELTINYVKQLESTKFELEIMRAKLPIEALEDLIIAEPIQLEASKSSDTLVDVTSSTTTSKPIISRNKADCKQQ